MNKVKGDDFQKKFKENEELIRKDESNTLFLNVEETAEFIRCSKATVYNMVKGGTMPFMRLGGRVVFFKPDIIAWMKEHAEGLVRDPNTGVFVTK